jgi:electron transfer flavoprotein alpha subunit
VSGPGDNPLAASAVTPAFAGRGHAGDDLVSGAGTLLVVVEPPRDGSETAGGRQPVGGALITEGTRLARELGVDARFVTWPADPAADLGSLATAVADRAREMGPVAVILADTDIGRQLAPMVAHRMGSGAVVGCSDVLVRGAALSLVKPAYGGWLEREIDPATGTVPVAALDLPGMGEPELPPEVLQVPEVLEVEPPVGPASIRRLDLAPPDPRSVDLVHARRIVAAGSGSASERLLAAAGELAELLGGSVGATRPVVDDGRLPKERLIGQTGRTVSPDLYLALGISGSPHHVAGGQKADRIVSINRDARAPIFQFSDVGYVADLEVVLPALVQKIKEWRDAPGEP